MRFHTWRYRESFLHMADRLWLRVLDLHQRLQAYEAWFLTTGWTRHTIVDKLWVIIYTRYQKVIFSLPTLLTSTYVGVRGAIWTLNPLRHPSLNRMCMPIPPHGHIIILHWIINLFHHMLRIPTLRHRLIALMVVDWDTFVIHMLYFPHKFVGSLRKDQTHLATTCFGTLFHHPIAHIGTWHNLLGLEPTSSSFGDWRSTN